MASQSRYTYVKSRKNGISLKTFSVGELKLFAVVILTTKFHDMALCEVSLATQWAPGPLHPKGKIRVSLPSPLPPLPSPLLQSNRLLQFLRRHPVCFFGKRF